MFLVSRVAHTNISDFLAVVRTGIGVNIEDTKSERVAGVAWRTHTDLTVVDLVVTCTTCGLIAVELRNLVNKLRRTEDVATSQTGSNARTSDIGITDLADATIA